MKYLHRNKKSYSECINALIVSYDFRMRHPIRAL